jgi:carbon-monoxide dehydrogenase large subunit
MRRLEDPPLLRGESRFVADLNAPGQVEAVVVRSVHAHARLQKIETAEAEKVPGVIGVWTSADLPKDLGPIPVRLSPAPTLLDALQHPLARQVVRYVGEPVAVVVAENRYRAEDAAAKVMVSYEPLRPLMSVGESLDAGPLFSALSSNVVYHRQQRKGGPPPDAATSRRRLSLTFRVQRHTAVPLETRGLLAVPEGERLTVYGATKVVHFNHRVLAEMLHMDPAHLRLVEVAVGGGFGVRGEFYPEDYLIPYLARLLGRPVRWVEDRLEHFHATNHSREQQHEVTVTYDDEGRLWSLEDDIWVDNGAYVRTHGVTVPELTQAMLPGPYAWPALDTRLHVVLTNKTPIGTYRGPGRFEGTFVRERLIDAVAASLHLDPLVVRQRNLIPPHAFPYSHGTSALGEDVVFDSGHYEAALTRIAQLMQQDTIDERKRAARARGRLRGLGFAFFVEKSGLGPFEEVRLVLDEEGMLTVYSGLAALGQGTVTTLVTLVQQQVPLPAEHIRVIYGDTDQVPLGYGSFASRGTVMGGNAAYVAARVLRQRILDEAAAFLEASADDVVLDAGGARVAGATHSLVNYQVLARYARANGRPLETREQFRSDAMTYPYGVHGVELDVDPETGTWEWVRYGLVYDVGRAVNRELVCDQLIGGVAQGIGGAALEELAYDADGQLVTASLVDYALPGAPDVPDVEVILTEEAPSSRNPLGIKGAGEGGVVGAAPAIANALADAVGAPPEAFTHLPLTAAEVRRWIRTLPQDGVQDLSTADEK